MKKLYSPSPELKEQYADIILIVTEVENALSVHLSVEERKALCVNLVNLRETTEQILQRAKYVKRVFNNYNKISLNVWMNAEPLYTLAEAIEIADEKLASRDRQKKLAEQSKESEAERAIRQKLEYEASRKLQELREKIEAELRQRIKNAEKFIKTCSEEQKVKIAVILNSKGKLGIDPHWREILHYFAIFILEEVEEMMKGSAQA